MAKTLKSDSRSCARRGGCSHLMKGACLTTCPHKPVFSSKKWKAVTGKKCGSPVLSSKKWSIATACGTKNGTNAKPNTCKRTKAKKSCCSN
jgi:hypothetical protein